MSVVLYLANQQVQAVVGTAGPQKIAVQQAYTAQAPEGSIINGIIMDADAFVEFIKGFWQANQLPSKDVTLVINSTKFVGKTIELPKLSDSKSMEFIEREFANVKKEEDEIFSYIPLAGGDSKLKRVYAESIATDFIREYMDIFQSAGIQVKTIYSGESSLISLVNMTVAKQYRTFVVLIADPITLTTLLWVDGSFYYFNSTRCFHEQGTEEYAMDVARSVSQIIQFMQAHQIEHELEVIQIAGIVGNDIRLYQMALNGQGISVPSQAFDSSALSAGNGDVQGYLHAASGLVSNGKWHNILNQLGGKKRKKDNAAGSGKGFLIIGITFAVAVLATLGCFFYKLMKQQELDALEDEVNNPTVLAQLDEYDTLVVRNSFLTSQYNAIADIDENLYTYPVCDDDILKVFTKCAGSLATVQFESFDANSGIVSITAKSDTVDNINVFIRALCNEDIFKTVDYTGYSYDSQTELWNINVTCTLTESAGR